MNRASSTIWRLPVGWEMLSEADVWFQCSGDSPPTPPIKLQSQLHYFDLIRRSHVKDARGGSNNGLNQIFA